MVSTGASSSSHFLHAKILAVRKEATTVFHNHAQQWHASSKSKTAGITRIRSMLDGAEPRACSQTFCCVATRCLMRRTTTIDHVLRENASLKIHYTEFNGAVTVLNAQSGMQSRRGITLRICSKCTTGARHVFAAGIFDFHVDTTENTS